MSELREASQAVVNYHDSVLENNTPDALIDRLRAALAQPPQTKEECLAAAIKQLDEMQKFRIEREERLGLAHPPRDAWRPASVDCRTCRHFAKLDCLSTAMCIDGSQYKSTNPVQLWERTT